MVDLNGELNVVLRGRKMAAIVIRLGAVLGFIRAFQNAPSMFWMISDAQTQISSPQFVESAKQNLVWQAIAGVTILAVYFFAEKLSALICSDDETIELSGGLERTLAIALQVAGLVILFDGLAGIGYGFNDLKNYLVFPNIQNIVVLLPRAWHTLLYVGLGILFIRYPSKVVGYLGRFGVG